MQHSLQSDPKFDWKLNRSKFNQTAQSMDSLQTSPKFDQKFGQTAQEEHRAATKAKSGTEHKPKSPQVTWCESSITINGKTMKALLLKTIEEGEDFNLTLLTYKTMPLNHSLPSPAELLNSRKYKTLSPTRILPARLQESYRQIMDKGKQMQAQLYDKNTRVLPRLEQSQKVVVQLDPNKISGPQLK